MNALDAAFEVLSEDGEPLHYRELTRRMLDRGLWVTSGRSPQRTVNSVISSDIVKRGEASRFRRVGRGLFALRQHVPREAEPQDVESEVMSFIDAAERVLRDSGSRDPMHYTTITEIAIERGLVNTGGQTPATSMNSTINTDIRTRQSRGEPPRFVRVGTGLYGLAEPAPRGLATEIGRHNKAVREELKARLHEMPPMAFEELIAALLAEMGFEEVERTQYSGDGGIDALGTLDVGGVARVRVAVQAKRWQSNVPPRVVREVRGTVGVRQGVIITTSDFGKGARDEAEQPGGAPVALVNGEQLTDLLIEHGVGVSRTAHEVLTLEELPGAEAQPA